MDDMARMLESYAGGLQQSFESVFERVGQSLTQSAQVMRMMNEVMESAMLQNLSIHSSYDLHSGLVIEVVNRSQIMLGQTKVSARVGNAEDAFFSTTLESLRAGDRIQLQAPIHGVAGSIAGFIELECISPGTQQPLTKRSPFRVFYFQQGAFEAVRQGEVGGAPDSSEVAVTSDRFPLTRVRKLLNLSPIRGILTDNEGRYRFSPQVPCNDGTVFYLSVDESTLDGAAFPVTVSATGSPSTIEERRRQCEQIIGEMEIEVASSEEDY